MIRRAAFAVLALVAFCLPLAAQQTGRLEHADVETITPAQLRVTGEPDIGPALLLYRPDLFSSVDGSVLIHGLSALTLLDGRRFPISTELGRMGTASLDFLPLAYLAAVDVQKVGASPRYGSDRPGGVLNYLRPNRNYSGGEVGLFFGKSGGKYGREDFETYITGTVGNDKFQITAGAAHRESSGRIQRSTR